MDFVGGYVGVSLKYCEYRDRIFRLLLLLCGIVSSGYVIHAIRKTRAGSATVFQVLSVVVVRLISLLLILQFQKENRVKSVAALRSEELRFY